MSLFGFLTDLLATPVLIETFRRCGLEIAQLKNE
jgi:hypothetical protein